MSWDFSDVALRQHIARAEFGLEKESLRVTPDGLLAKTSHPFTQSNVDRDFCENQVEMITAVHSDVKELFKELREIHSAVNRELKKCGELLWPFSNPPIVRSSDDITIAHFEGELKEREDYRRYLAEKYGKTKMLYSGIHFNFSFSPEVLLAAFQNAGQTDYRSFKDRVYIELGRKLLGYIWLIVYLTAASPLSDQSFLRLSGLKQADGYRYASFRCSGVGYWNDFLPILDFSDIESYVKSIRGYIENGLLYAASELYYPLRLKPAGKNSLGALSENGVNHVELRCLDVNPLSPVGLFEEDIRFLHLLMLYLMSRPDVIPTEFDQRTAIENSKTAALFNDAENRIEWCGRLISVKAAAEKTLDEIEYFSAEYAPDFLPDVAFQRKKLTGKRYAEQIRERFTDYISDGLRLAKQYRG